MMCSNSRVQNSPSKSPTSVCNRLCLSKLNHEWLLAFTSSHTYTVFGFGFVFRDFVFIFEI